MKRSQKYGNFQYMAKYMYSPTKQKILFLLASGLVVGLSSSPHAYWQIAKILPKALKEINRKTFRRILKEFKHERLVDFRDEKDGTVSIVISELGEKLALRYQPEQMTIKRPSRWDKKWRLVIFDIPERFKNAREALRKKLKELGFVELQKSVWALPYPCENEIKFLAEFFEVSRHVRLLTVEKISMDADLKLHFELS